MSLCKWYAYSQIYLCTSLASPSLHMYTRTHAWLARCHIPKHTWICQWRLSTYVIILNILYIRYYLDVGRRLEMDFSQLWNLFRTLACPTLVNPNHNHSSLLENITLNFHSDNEHRLSLSGELWQQPRVAYFLGLQFYI